MHFASESGARAKARERADAAIGPNACAVDDAVREYLGIRADLAVANDAAGADAHPVTKCHRSLQHHVDVEEDVITVSYRATYVEPCGIGKRHAGEEQVAGMPLATEALELGELRLVVDAKDLAGIARADRVHRNSVFHRHRDDVGQVVLALGIVRLEPRDPAAEELRGCGQHARVAFADGALRGSRVFLLDDLLYEAAPAAHDATVAVGALGSHGQQRHLALAGEGEEPLESLAGDQRHVSIEHEHDVAAGNLRHHLQQRVPRAETLGLQRPGELLRGEYLTHALAAVAIDDVDRIRLERSRRVDHVLEQWTAGKRLQHLRDRRLHALALARGENDDRQHGAGLASRTLAPGTLTPGASAGRAIAGC